MYLEKDGGAKLEKSELRVPSEGVIQHDQDK